jgi:hypothetical protein
MTRLVLVIILLTSPIFAQSEIKGFQSSYDRFKDVTRTVSKPVLVKRTNKAVINGIWVTGSFSYTGETIQTDAPYFFLDIEPWGRCQVWCFSAQHKAIILADGKPFDFVDTMGHWYGNIAASSESVRYILTRGELEKLLTAQKVEIQIGRFEGEVKKEQLDMFRNLLTLGSKTKL